MNFNKEIAKIIRRPIHDTGWRLHTELLYAIEPLCNTELPYGIGWPCGKGLSHGSEPLLHTEPLCAIESLHGIGWSFFYRIAILYKT